MARINNDLDLSQHGADCIKIFEEDRLEPILKAYDDGTGTPTIGWGCTTGVTMGMKITKAQAEAMFRAELAEFIEAVRSRIIVRLTQDQFDALVSFFYNEGSGAGASLVRAINSGKLDRIPACFMLYNKARKGKGEPLEVWPGLIKRRNQEIALWSGVFTDPRIATSPAPLARDLVTAEEPGRSPTKIAAQSPTVWSLVFAFFVAVLDGLKHAIHTIGELIGSMPNAVSDAQSTVSSFTSVMQMLDINSGKISVWVTAALLMLACVRNIDLHRIMGD